MSTDFEKLNIILAARDREFARAMERNTRRVERFTRQSNQNLSKTSRSFDGIAAAARKVGPALAAIGATAAINKLRATTRSIAELGDNARRAGVNVEAFQQLKFVGEQNRIGVDALTDGLKELNLRADEFLVTGAGPAAEAFDRLGYTAADLARRLEDPPELLLDIIGRLEQLDDAARIRITDEVFGGTAGERFVELVGRGEASLRATMERAREVGAVLDADVVERAAELDRKFSEVQERVSTLFRTVVVEGVGAFEQLSAALRPGAEDLERAASAAERLAAAGVEVSPDAGSDQMEQVADEAEAVSLSYVDLAAAADAAAEAIERNSLSVGAAGYADEALALYGMAEEMRSVAQALRNGTGDASALADQLGVVTGEAQATVEAVRAIDGVSMGGVISRLNIVTSVLDGVRRAGNAAAAAVAAATAAPPPAAQQRDAGRLTRMEDRLAPSVAPPPAPWNGPRPVLRPDDIDFGYNPPEASGGGGGGGSGGGGGGGGGGGRQSEFASEMQRLREDIARLKIEAAEFGAVAAAGTEVGDAMEYARTRADLLYAAQQDGREITPELRAEIDALALSLAEESASADAATDALRDHERQLEDVRRTAETLEGSTESLFASIVTQADSAGDAVSRLLDKLAGMAAEAAFSGMFSGVFDGIAPIFTPGGGAPSFDGGGSTGGGPRLGGVDGKGGFWAVMHPNESVIDHTRGGGTPATGGAGVRLTYAPVIDARGADAAAVARIEQQQRQLSRDFEARAVRAIKTAQTRRMF